MSTTNLFVELIVIGTGAAFWIVLAIFTVFNRAFVTLDNLMSWPALIPVLSIIYVAGIIVDRWADKIFSFIWRDSLRAKWFKTEDDYYAARTLIYTQSDSLRDLFEYSRSRLRICRG